MRENNRKPIEERYYLPQFTTMNVIDGQAGLVFYSSLIFYSLTINNILNIIVLLILAGVTIMTLFGENGLISMAQKAKQETENAQANAIAGMNNLINSIDKTLGIYRITDDEVTKIASGPRTVIDSTGKNKIKLPAGFRIKTSEGTSVKQGIVITDSNVDNGNEFVWIPVGTVYRSADDQTPADIKLGRYNFSRSAVTSSENVNIPAGTPVEVQLATNYAVETVLMPNHWDSSYKDSAGKLAVTQELATSRPGGASSGTNGKNATAKNLKEFVDSVTKNGGYYLARYEASYGSEYKADGSDDVAKYGSAKPLSQPSTATTFNSDTTGSLWNNITQLNASKVCQNMYSASDENIGVKSDLVNSYAWDTAIVYIQGMGTDNFSNFTKGNVGSKTSRVDTGTNSDDKFCNIYDMVANLREWSTEYSSLTTKPCVGRGGNCSYNGSCTAYRVCDETTFSHYNIGFRPLLYVK